MRRWRIVLAVLGGLLAAVVLAAAVGAAVAVRRPRPQIDGTVRLDVLEGPVEVYRDAFGVPHVYADTVDDLFTAQGYVHAQDRFWQMDVRRHTTAGRLSELFGAGQIDVDRVIRTMGWRRIAERELELLSADSVRILEAYADGVNAYLADRGTAAIALEYTVLGLQRPGYEPEPWTPVDSLAWLDLPANDLHPPNVRSSRWRHTAAFNRGPVAVGGGPSIVLATGWTASAGYEVDWVPSMRMVVDLADLDASRWIDLTGVSGHAFSDHYTDQVRRWADGRSLPMRWSAEAVRAGATDRLRLLPPAGTGRQS